MRTIAALLAAFPLLAAAQTDEPVPPPAQAAPPAYAPPPQAYAPPPTYAPPPQGAAPAAPQYYARPSRSRDSWYIGFGIGGGDGHLKVGSQSMSFEDYVGPSPMQLAMNFKVGATLSPRLLLGADITAFRSQWDGNGSTIGAQVSTYNVVATFFPMEKGFFVRGGVGIARFSYNADLSGYGKLTDDASGFNFMGGAGYAFWLGQQFNLTVNLDFTAQSYGTQNDTLGLLPESSNFWALGVGCDWY